MDWLYDKLYILKRTETGISAFSQVSSLLLILLLKFYRINKIRITRSFFFILQGSKTYLILTAGLKFVLLKFCFREKRI